MHTITGSGKLFVIILLVLSSCKGEDQQEEGSSGAATVNVNAVHITTRKMEQSLSVPATAAYLRKSDLLAPISGYVKSLTVKQGDRIHKGQIIAHLETREHRTIQNDPSVQDSLLLTFGKIPVTAPGDGFINYVNQQSGNYVVEGTSLCGYTLYSDLLIKAFVPGRYRDLATIGKKVQISLSDKPDSTFYTGKIVEFTNEVDPVTQALIVLIKTDKYLALEQGLYFQVRMKQNEIQQAQVLPVKALLSNEKMNRFWIMKMINDSTAVKQNVQPGLIQNDSVQILQPHLSPDLLILTEGNYGLPDTAKVALRK